MTDYYDDDDYEDPEEQWAKRTHTVSDPSGDLTVTCDRDRRIIALGIGSGARGQGEHALQTRLQTLMQLAWEKAGVGLRTELAERNPNGPIHALDGLAPTREEYAAMERRTFGAH